MEKMMDIGDESDELRMTYLDNTSNNPHHQKADIRLTIQGYGQIHKVKSENLTTTIYSGRSVFGSSGPHRTFRA